MVAKRQTRQFRYSKARMAGIVWPFVAVVLAQAVIASLSIQTLSAVRAFTAGESSWSKGYKQGIHSLEHYIASGDVEEFRRFETSMEIPLGSRRARLALEATPLDVDGAREGLLTSRNHPDDITGMIWVYRYFNRAPYFAEAVEKWSLADPKVIELVDIAREIVDTRRIPGVDDPSAG